MLDPPNAGAAPDIGVSFSFGELDAILPESPPISMMSVGDGDLFEELDEEKLPSDPRFRKKTKINNKY